MTEAFILDHAEPRRVDVLPDLLRAVGIDRSSTILITGPVGLASVMWFCRHGYEHVGYSRLGPAPTEPCDLVFAPHTCDLALLEAIVENGPHPRDGGALIVRTWARTGWARAEGGAAAESRDPAVWLLRRGGYRLERRVPRGRRDLLVARRWASAGRRKAA